MIPYSENNFIIGNGLTQRFKEAFLQQFTRKQRLAIRNVALLNIRWFDFELIPLFLPGVEHLVIGAVYVARSLRHYLARVANQKMEEIDLPNLLGVAVRHQWSATERESTLVLEMALLKRKRSK